MPHRLTALADLLAQFNMPCEIVGDPNREITGVATLDEAGPTEISFLSNAKYEKALSTTKAGVVIVSKEQDIPSGMCALRAPDPYAAVTVVMVHVHGYRKHERMGVDPRAVVDPTSKIGENPGIGHNVTIGANVTIGKNVVMYPGVYVARDCRIGDDCTFYPNVTIYEGSVLGHRVRFTPEA